MLRNIVTRFVAISMLLCAFSVVTHASDIQINPTGPVFQVSSSLKWGATGAGAINNNFFFSPNNITESVCAYTYNNNPSNLHKFVVTISVTGNASELTPSDGTWNIAANSNVSALASPSPSAMVSAMVSGAALVSIGISGNSTATGNPDTATLIIVQTPSGQCFSGQNTNTAATQVVAAVEPEQQYSDTLSTAFTVTGSLTNPPASQSMVDVNVNAGAKTLYFQRALVTNTTSSAWVFEAVGETTVSAGCSTATPANLKIGNANVSTATAGTACSGVGSASPAIHFSVPANCTYEVDLAGYIAPANSTDGLNLQPTATVTGNIIVDVLWYEK